ncbi:MAG: UbiX family flavin prenyltransferase [Dehalococcoidia bacterium]|nr:UbiX family flavin prenyltransferase [Dehalococcoidia bacterium]
MDSPRKKYPVVVGISGASGAVLARATIDRLLSDEHPVIATATAAARMVWRQESEESFGEALERWADWDAFTYCPVGDLTAPIASGTFPTAGMVVTPCSMATVAAISSGFADNLLRRAADVTLKEKRPLVIVPRETPLTETHLENMARLARQGVVVLPPHPPFYLGDGSIRHTVDFIVERTMVALGLTDRMPQGMTYREPERYP